MRACVLKMHGGNLWRISNNLRVCVLVCGINMYVPVSTGAREANQICVCVSGQTDLSTGDVSGFEMHGFSTAATGHVSFPDESEETPTRCPRPSLKSWMLRLPIRARRLCSSSSVCEGGGSIFCVPPSSCPLLGLCPIPGSFLQRSLFKRPSRCFVRLWTVLAWESTFCCMAVCVCVCV